MVRNALAAKVVALGIAAFGIAHDPSCGSVEPASSGVNAPCTRDKDCRGDLVCEKGVCTSKDNDDDGGTGPGDAAHDG